MENQILLNLAHTLVNITDFNFTGSGIGEDNYSYESYEYFSDFYANKFEYVGEWEIAIRGYVTFFIALATILSNIVLVSVIVFHNHCVDVTSHLRFHNMPHTSA
uniref:Uncharacterized protein n=1 Tax=Magallana gigas TaxID=29159 RepID=K1Q2D4_MAGGI